MSSVTPKGPPGGLPIDSDAGQISHPVPASPTSGAKKPVGQESQKTQKSPQSPESQEITAIREGILRNNNRLDEMRNMMSDPMVDDARYTYTITKHVFDLYDRIQKLSDVTERNQLNADLLNLADRVGITAAQLQPKQEQDEGMPFFRSSDLG